MRSLSLFALAILLAELPTDVTTEINTKISDSPDGKHLEEKHIISKIGEKFTFTIETGSFFDVKENCSIITPAGIQYNLDDLSIDHIEAMSTQQYCSVTITVASKEEAGIWTLVYDGLQFSEKIQRRLAFTINIEETVSASVSSITVVQGKDLYVRLKNAADDYGSCRLLSPNGNEYEQYEKDDRYKEYCGFIIRNIQVTDSGSWTIVYGNGIIYRAPIQVTVNAAVAGKISDYTWYLDRPVAEVLGAKDAVYCRITGPDGLVHYEGFGRCQILLERALPKHDGIWNFNVGLPDRILTENYSFNVKLVEADGKPQVTTLVVANKPTVSLTCSVSSPKPISACKFRHPSGRTLMANEGIGEDRFSYHGTVVGYQSEVQAHECGISINNPQVEDLGLWRCAMESEDDVYYGFLKAVCSWAIRDPEIAATVVTEPTLKASRYGITSLAGDSVSMSCSLQSAIRYCYFRARNGTVFNVGPDNYHTGAAYLGSGLDAGECGIWFPSLEVTDSGPWSCHVGLANETEPEQLANFNVNVVDPMIAAQRHEGSRLTVEAEVYDNRVLDYCRFVRIDGLGFTNDNVPEDYINISLLPQGKCGIVIDNPSIMEHHPWTIVAKIRGQDVEITRVTSMSMAAPSTPATAVYYRVPFLWIMLILLSFVLSIALFSSKHNRQWTRNKASAIGNSVRNSFIRKSVPANTTHKNTAMAA